MPDIPNLNFYEWLYDQHITQLKSINQISEELNTYPNKVFRAMKSHGVPIRKKDEAQTNALKTGRAKHPKVKTQKEPTSGSQENSCGREPDAN